MSTLSAIEYRKYKEYGSNVEFQTILDRLFDSERIELFPDLKIVRLNIRFAEQFCDCNDSEWEKLNSVLREKDILIKNDPWMDFWERVGYFVRFKHPREGKRILTKDDILPLTLILTITALVLSFTIYLAIKI